MEFKNISKKRIIFIASILIFIIATAIFLYLVNSNNKKPDKTSAKVTDSSMIDESSSSDSSSDDSSSAGDSKLDSSSILNSDSSSAIVTDSQGNPSTPTSPSTTGGSTTAPGATTTKTPTGTTPSATSMTFEVESFVPAAEKNVNTGLGQYVFEYMFGKQKIINGVPTKYMQKKDKLILKTSSKVTSVSFDSNLIYAEKTNDNHITITANTGDNVTKNTTIVVNGKYKYNLKLFRSYSYYNDMCLFEITYIYWTENGKTFYSSNDVDFNYSNGIAENSITKTAYISGGNHYDDVLTWHGTTTVKNLMDLLNEYKRRGYSKINVRAPAQDASKTTFCASK